MDKKEDIEYGICGNCRKEVLTLAKKIIEICDNSCDD